VKNFGILAPLPGFGRWRSMDGRRSVPPSFTRSVAGAAAVLVGIGQAIFKSRSSDGTFISRLEPIFVHSISPLFILL
jgi:hypothetical protein